MDGAHGSECGTALAVATGRLEQGPALPPATLNCARARRRARTCGRAVSRSSRVARNTQHRFRAMRCVSDGPLGSATRFLTRKHSSVLTFLCSRFVSGICPRGVLRSSDLTGVAQPLEEAGPCFVVVGHTAVSRYWTLTSPVIWYASLFQGFVHAQTCARASISKQYRSGRACC